MHAISHFVYGTVSMQLLFPGVFIIYVLILQYNVKTMVDSFLVIRTNIVQSLEHMYL